ncbi:MAG: hypothetical protein KC468_08800, partial [Myxococcales bacterium]|nr:hypothetical protein [Myxococcales bacterium]
HLLRPASLAQLELWQQLAQELVCAYASAFYRHHRRRYQLRGATLAWLHALPPAPRAAFLPDAYELLVETDGAAGVPAPTLDLPEHLYAPLLVDVSGTRARPPALARDEARFVQTLSEWRAASPGRAASLSLLRLPEGEHGRALVGGPGFLLWTTRGAARRLVYVVFLRARGQLERWLCERPWEPLGAVQAEPGAPAVSVDAWAITTLERGRAPKQLRDGADARRRHVAFQRERGHLEPLLG